MLMIDRENSKTQIQIVGTSAEIALDLMELIANFSIRLEEQIDIKGLIHDDETLNEFIALIKNNTNIGVGHVPHPSTTAEDNKRKD